MKQTIFLIFSIMFLVLIFSFTSLVVSAEENKYAQIEVSLLNQDPYPCLPNNYVEVVFKVENVGRMPVDDVMIEILPQYPFSLDSGASSIKELGTLGIIQYGEKAVFVKYKLRVDKDAIDGENEIKLRYTYNTNKEWKSYITKAFNITIEDSKTDFDIAIQDYSPETGTLSIAISNIGDQDANSVTVTLPEQSSLQIIGSDKEIIGGIERNDYTVASFKVLPKEDAPIIVRISYTDSIGIRREVEKAVMFKASSYGQKIVKEDQANNRALIYIIIGVVGIVVIILLFRVLRKKRK